MLTSDFKEFAALLNANRVEYLIVGAMHWRPMAIPAIPAIWISGLAPTLQTRGACSTRWSNSGLAVWVSGWRISRRPTRSFNWDTLPDALTC